MQMASAEASQQAAAQVCSQMFEVDDALRQHMLPYLELRNIMQLAGTCSGWRLLINYSSPDQLSEEARRAVLSSGLTSSLPLLQLIKQQAQLVATLRGKPGFTPRVQRLSLKDDSVDGSQRGNAQQNRSVRLLFSAILWSPCVRLEDASRWLALDPSPACSRIPVVVDTETGRQVCFKEGPSSRRTDPEAWSSSDAAWLTDKQDRILFFLSVGSRQITSEPVASLVNAQSQSILPVVLPGPHRLSKSQFLTVCSKEGSTMDVLCCVHKSENRSAGRTEDQISVFNASSGQLLYQFNCPQQLHLRSLQLPLRCHGQQVTSGQQGRSESIESRQRLLAPTKKFLAITWHFQLILPSCPKPMNCLGLSIHSAISGDLQHSMLLTDGMNPAGSYWQPSWLPCSSKLLILRNAGLLHLMTSSGCILWSNARADRKSDLFGAPADGDIGTRVSASPCGRWIVVMDGYGTKIKPPGRVAVVEASTGNTLAKFHSHKSVRFNLRSGGIWSMSGDTCLLEDLALVFVCRPQARPTFRTFQVYELWTRSHAQDLSPQPLSLSPCGSIVVGLDNTCDTGLQHWQIPQTSAIGNEAASTSRTLQPIFCAEFMSGRQFDNCQDLKILQLAWHPRHSACMYAIASWKSGVHLIDAKANRCVHTWNEDELYGPASPSDPARVRERITRSISKFSDPRVLSWSKDGCRLGIASATSLTCGARCSVLHFSGSSA